MSVLFLDFDGVLGPLMFDPDIRHGGPQYGVNWTTERRQQVQCQNLMAWVIEATGCIVVVSSSWRQGATLAEMQDVLMRAQVVTRRSQVFDLTPVLADGVRGDEIKAWLADHPWVERYAIVDDGSDAAATSWRTERGLFGFDADPELSDRFVRTNARVGIDEQGASALMDLLAEVP